jgi:hypothetical protein
LTERGIFLNQQSQKPILGLYDINYLCHSLKSKAMKRIILITLISFLTISIFAPNRSTKLLLEGGALMAYLLIKQKQQQYAIFKDHMGCRENYMGDWKNINKYGFMGLYQFGTGALKETGFEYVTRQSFKENPNIWPVDSQNIAFDRLVDSNLVHLDTLVDFYNGKKVYGIKITKSGLAAACHLSGVGGVRNFLKYGINPCDSFGTRLTDYMVEFAGYGF